MDSSDHSPSSATGKAVFRNPSLRWLAVGQVISQVGDSVFQIALLWLIFEITGSEAMTGVLGMFSFLPILLFGIAGGVLADRFDRRRMMVVSDVLRAVVLVALASLLFLGYQSVALLFAATFAVATFGTIFHPARDALVPQLVSRQGLLQANSLLQVSGYAALLVGPVLAAILLSIPSLASAHLVALDALTFLVSALVLLRLPRGMRRELNPMEMSQRGWHELTAAFDVLRRDRRLAFMLVLTAVNNLFIMGPALVGTPIFVREVLGRGAEGYALVESGLGLGMVVGSFLVTPLARRFGKGRTLLAGMIFDGATFVLLYWCRDLSTMIALMAFHALAIPSIVVTRTALVQEWVEDETLGRVFSLVNISVVGMSALSAGLTGLAVAAWTAPVVFGFFGLGGLLCGVVGWWMTALRKA